MNKLKDLKLKNQLIISTYIMLFILLIFKPTLIPSIYNRLIIAFKPFIIGGLIAFLINIPMKLIEEKIIKPLTKNHEKLNKLSRIIALVFYLWDYKLFCKSIFRNNNSNVYTTWKRKINTSI